MSKWKTHKEKWSNCTLCELCETRNKVVLFKGKIPCEILFVGEAPGKSENMLGKPFMGPAGHLLDQMVTKAGLDDYRRGYTNLVSCIPLDIDGEKLSDPDKEHIKACDDRLTEMIQMCKPKYLVAVGKLAHKFLVDKRKKLKPGHYTTITHPGAILRADITQKGIQVQRAVATLRDLIDDVPF